MKDNCLTKLCNLVVMSCVAFLCLGLLEVRAQTAVEVAEDRAADLRIQLDDVKARQAELEDQLEDLDEQMDPQNIENSLAGVGSTRPEDLRELRRRQLERQKISVQNSLSILAENQSRLETAIADAEADAYYESAQLMSSAPQVPDNQAPDNQVPDNQVPDNQVPDKLVTQSNDPAKTVSASDTTEKTQTRPRRVHRSDAKQASGINNP